MTVQHHYVAPIGRKKRHTIVQMCEWVKKCLHDIRPKTNVKNFENCCNNIALDGSEDDLLLEVSAFSSNEK